MKDRYNHGILEKQLKKLDYKFFVPLRISSYEIKDDNTLEICYYHNADLYDLMYDKEYESDETIYTPSGRIRMILEGMYVDYRLDPPFKLKYYDLESL